MQLAFEKVNISSPIIGASTKRTPSAYCTLHNQIQFSSFLENSPQHVKETVETKISGPQKNNRSQ